jgi:hypothetical protein
MAFEAIDPAELRDPIQGMDVLVKVIPLAGDNAGKNVLVGGFTDLMFKIVSQTEAYLPLNTRYPRMLDGEIIVVWSMSRGLISLDVIGSTFGPKFKTAFETGRSAKLPRSTRFDISFSTQFAADDVASLTDDAIIRNDTINNGEKYRIKYCRVDTMTFGVTSGRHVAANSWQGTGQWITGETGTAAAPATPASPAP